MPAERESEVVRGEEMRVCQVQLLGGIFEVGEGVGKDSGGWVWRWEGGMWVAFWFWEGEETEEK